MASTDLTRTHTVATADERKKHTFSAWIKLSHVGSTSNVIFANRPSNTYRFYYMIMNSSGGGNTVPNAFYTYMVYNGSEMLEASGTRKLRDVNGWYHIVVRTDTTQAAAADRFRVYINGEQDSVTLHHAPDQNEELQVNRDTVHYIGEEGNGNGQFNGSMSHIHFCDGYSYGPDSFGSTDSTTGEWKINTSPSVSYGTNGFFILKDGNSVTDQSGNSHNWAVNAGTLTKTEDCPSNIFATYNSIQNLNDNNALSNGNTTQKETDTVGQRQAICNIGGFTGKYYAEFKMINLGPQNGSSPYCGVLSMSNYDNDTYLGNNGIAMHPGGNIYRSASIVDSQTSITYTTNSIVSVALDITNNKCHFRVNGGTWLASGDPANNTGGYDISSLNTGDGMTFASSVFNNNCQWSVNFGNGYFGTTAVASAGTNASNNGIFEYDVPTGFTALSTKGLNE